MVCPSSRLRGSPATAAVQCDVHRQSRDCDKLLSEKVKRGLSQSPSEVIREGLRPLEEQDRL
jgi:hypothetical protein